MTHSSEWLFLGLLAIPNLSRCLIKWYAHILLPFFLLLNFFTFLCMLDISPLWNIKFVTISFQSVACLFLKSRCFEFYWSTNHPFFFLHHAFDVIAKKSLPNRTSQDFSNIHYGNFVALGGIFMSMLHLELLFYIVLGINRNLYFAYRYRML